MRFTIGFIALAMLLPSVAATQSPGIAEGARVRVTAPALALKKHVTTVGGVRGDSIVVGLNGGWRTIALADVSSLEVSTGRRSMFARDAAVGFGLGALSGATMAFAFHKECEAEVFMDCFLEPDSRAEAATWGAMAGGALGLLTGAIVGAMRRADVWAPARVPVRANVTPAGGVRIAVSRTF